VGEAADLSLEGVVQPDGAQPGRTSCRPGDVDRPAATDRDVPPGRREVGLADADTNRKDAVAGPR
jgi:hypothetical protein